MAPETADRVLALLEASPSIDTIDITGQMLELEFGGGERAPPLWDLETFSGLEGRAIATGPHCFDCTAGAGSSCGGALF